MTALLFLHRPVMSAGMISWAGITALTEGLYVLLALSFLLFRWQNLRAILLNTSIPVKICAGILLFSGLLHWLTGGYYRPEYLGSALVWCILPLFAAVYRDELERLLPVFLAVFWLFNVINCIAVESISGGMTGLTGNWNWSAVLLLVTFPFAVEMIPEQIRYRKLWIILICLISFWLSIYLQSRAMILSFAGAALFWCFLRFKRIRLFLVAGGLLLLLAGSFLAVRVFPERTDSFLKGEIRMEIWKGTVNLLQDFPHGTGVVTFENTFIPYRTQDYFLNPHAAIRTTHPHNELLYVAAALGIPAALAFLIWLGITFLSAVREYDAGKTEKKRVLYLLAFTALLINSLLDLTFHVWPTGILALLFFGMFAFPGERESLPETVSPAKRIGQILLGLTVLMAIANLIGTFCWEASDNRIRNMDNVQARKFARAAVIFAPEFQDLIYRSAIQFSSRDRAFSMELIGRIQNSPWKDYAHIHALKAQNYAMMLRDADAIPEYLMDAQCYPLQILPYFGAMTAYGRLGRQDMALLMQKKIIELAKLRNLTQQEIGAILRNPEYDMHPERIGQKKFIRASWELP